MWRFAAAQASISAPCLAPSLAGSFMAHSQHMGLDKAMEEPWLPATPQTRGYRNASKVCTKASSRILGKVLAELSNTPDFYSYDRTVPFQKLSSENQDQDDTTDDMLWANEVEDSAVNNSTSDTQEDRRERVMWKKMKDRPGHHRRYQTRRQKREPEAEWPGVHSSNSISRFGS